MQELSQPDECLVGQRFGIDIGSDENRVVEDEIAVFAVISPDSSAGRECGCTPEESAEGPQALLGPDLLAIGRCSRSTLGMNTVIWRVPAGSFAPRIS